MRNRRRSRGIPKRNAGRPPDARPPEANPSNPAKPAKSEPHDRASNDRAPHSLSSSRDAFGGLVVVTDGAGIIQSASGREKLLRRPPSALLGLRLRDVLGKKAYAPFGELFRRAMAAREPAADEFPCVLGEGLVPVLHTVVIPVADENGTPSRWVWVARDVTEPREDERRLRQKEALLAQAEQIANMGSWERNLETGELHWSEHRYRMLGLQPNRPPATVETLRQMIHPDDRERVWAEVKRAVARREIADSEFRIVLSDGTIRTVHRRAVPIYNDRNKAVRLVGMTQDITDRKAEEDRLRKSEALLAQAEQIARMGSFVVDIDANTLTWSDQFCRNMGLPVGRGPASPDVFRRMVHPDDRERFMAETERTTKRGEMVDSEFRVVLGNGAILTLHRRAVPICDESGKPVRVVGITQDITGRKTEEDRLRKSEALLAQAEEIANFGSWEYNFETRRYTLSRQLLRMYGFQRDEPWDEDVYWQRIPAVDRERVRAASAQGVASCKPFEFVTRYRMPDGAVRIYHSQAVPITAQGGALVRVRGVVRDITGQMRTEEDLHRLSQELIRLRDAERRQLARELHESAGQTLASLKMTLGNLGELLPEDDQAARELLQTARQFAGEAVREIRVVSYLMHPAMLDESGLGPALRWYAKGFSDRSGIPTQVDVPENFGRQRQEIEMTIFRIVQEALTNVHRYSGSQTAAIRLTCQDARILVEIEDTGCGLPAPGSTAPRNAAFGVGIAGMRERVKQLHGRFHIRSAPGRGTTVLADLPLSPDQDADSWIVPGPEPAESSVEM